MKKIYLFITLPVLVTSLNVNSQPVLTLANTTPVAGEVFSFNSYPATSPLPVTNGGPSQTWDITPYAGTSVSFHVILDPASTPYSALYPAATIAALYPGGVYDYHLASSSEYSYLGAATNVSSTIYTDFYKELGLPVTYGDSFTDSFDNGMGQFGNLSATADGYGTLIAPSFTLNNVLRIHVTSITTGAAGDTIFRNNYYWYSPGIHHFVCSYSEQEQSYNNLTYYTFFYMDQTSTGIPNAASGTQEGIFLYPNPAHDVINITGMEKFESASVINLQGQVLKKVVPVTASFNTGNLSRGIYFLKLAGKDKLVYLKFRLE